MNTAPVVEGSKAKQLTRLEKAKADGKEPELPELDAGEYLVSHLWDAGPVMHGAAGAVPLSQSEIRAWQDNTGNELQPWEVRLLRRLSADYISASKAAEKPNCPPPWQPTIEAEQRQKVAKHIRNVLRD